MAEDIEDYLDCLSGDLKAQAQVLVDALNNDKNQATKARLEARMATTQINQRIHDIAEARWKMLPIAVQREHDTLAMDIAELQWHLKQETAELRKAQNKLDYAKTINRRVKADIDFNKEHSPLVEEKLRLEQVAIQEIQGVQQYQDDQLTQTKMRLEAAEAEFRTKSQTLIAERDQHKAKLDKVLNTLHALKTDLEQKENKRRDFVEKIESAKIRIEAQEQEISDLNSAAEDMRKQERQETARIETLRNEIRELDQVTFDLDNERSALEEATRLRHDECQLKLEGLKETHANLITKLENLSNERDEVRLNNEDAQKRHKMSLKNKAKLEKDIERLEKQNESTKSEFERLTLKVKQLVNQNSELEQLIERKARHAQATEDNLASMIDTTKAQIEESARVKQEHETKLAFDEKELANQRTLLAETRESMDAYIDKLRAEIKDLDAQLVDVKEKTETVKTDLGIVETELLERTNLNREEIDKLTSESNELNSSNAIKAKVKNDLQTKLDNLIEHEAELIQRTKDLKTQQVLLTEKREKVLADIEQHKERLKIVENDHKIQEEANNAMKDRLKDAQIHAQKRQEQFEKLINDREHQKKVSMDRLRDEVLLNAQLAHEYKVLQTREMAVKNALAGFFETRVALQDTKAWFDRLMVMEQRYFEKTSNTNQIREKLHLAEFSDFKKDAERHIERVSQIEQSLDKGVRELTGFLEQVLGPAGQETVRKVAHDAMLQPI